VEGASVYLYAAGEASIGSASMLLNPNAPSTTDVDGNFTVTGEVACPTSGSQLYLVARGGNTAGGATSSLALMIALGPCRQLSSGENVTLNEATTVVSVYALSGFMKDETHTGADRASSAGMARAFAEVHNLVDPRTGIVRIATTNGAGAVSQTKINTLANIVHRCIAATGKSTEVANACGALSLNQAGSNTADTLQAVLSIASNGGGTAQVAGRTSALYALAEANGPFQPAMEEKPVDWNLGVTFDLSNVGALSGIAIDRNGNAWVAGGSSITEVSSVGEGSQGSCFTDPALTDAKAIAIDARGHIWVLSGKGAGSLIEFRGDGIVLSPPGGYSGVIADATNIAADALDRIWVSNKDGSVAALNGSDGSLITTYHGPAREGISLVTALDGSGRLWTVDASGNSVREAADVREAVSAAKPLLSAVPSTLAFDGSGNLWVLNRKNSAVTELLGVGTPVAVPTANRVKEGAEE
jgi:hypothetical protein